MNKHKSEKKSKKMEGWEERFDKLSIVKTLSATQGIFLTIFFRKELADARREEREICKKIYVEALNWAESDEEAERYFDENYSQATLRKEPHV